MRLWNLGRTTMSVVRVHWRFGQGLVSDVFCDLYGRQQYLSHPGLVLGRPRQFPYDGEWTLGRSCPSRHCKKSLLLYLPLKDSEFFPGSLDVPTTSPRLLFHDPVPSFLSPYPFT